MGSRGVLCAHEANAGQRAGWSGEGQGTVQVAGPDRAAERSAGPQAAGVAKDRLTRQKIHSMEQAGGTLAKLMLQIRAGPEFLSPYFETNVFHIQLSQSLSRQV